MYSLFPRRRLPLLTVALAWLVLISGGQAQPPKDTPNTPAAIKKALEQKITLDFQTQDFNAAFEHLQQKTKIRFVVDNRFVFLEGGLPGAAGTTINLKSDNGKVKTALQATLSQLQLTYVILGDLVFITTAEVAIHQQMNQRVTVDVRDVPLGKVIKQLAEDTATNLMLDPRQADKAKNKVTLELEDVTLETAVRLLTEIAGLNSVRVGNVLFITSDERADKLRKEIPPPSTHPLDPLLQRYGVVGGFMPGIGGIGGPPQPPVVAPPPKEPAPPPGKELGKPQDPLEVRLIDPQQGDVEKLQAELKQKDILIKKLQRQLEDAALTLEQATKEAVRLQAELKILLGVIETREKSIVKLQEEVVKTKSAELAAKNERDATIARAQALFEKLKAVELLMQQLAKGPPPLAPKNPPPILLEGTIEAVDKALVKIDLGTDQGVKKDNTLEVYRLKPEPKYLGRILVIDADFRHSLARLIVQPGEPVPTLMPGDLVATKLPKDFDNKKPIEKKPADELKGKNVNNPPAVFVEGTVELVDKDGMVKISLGTDHGVKKDHTLEVYRLKPEPKYLGRIVLLEVGERSSVARLLPQPGVAAPTLQPGDKVASKLQ